MEEAPFKVESMPRRAGSATSNATRTMVLLAPILEGIRALWGPLSAKCLRRCPSNFGTRSLGPLVDSR